MSDADKQALEGDPKWESSRFGELEKFILDYLVGGSSAGESVRLKLQSPLYVTDALLEAAAQQLSEDLEVAQQVKYQYLGKNVKAMNLRLETPLKKDAIGRKQIYSIPDKFWLFVHKACWRRFF